MGRRRLGWTDDFAGRREARVSRLDFKTKPLDPLDSKMLGTVEREKELRAEITEANLSDLRE